MARIPVINSTIFNLTNFMQEAEEKDIINLSAEEQFLGYQESFEEAQARAAEESKGFAKVERFKMDKAGTYVFRILPLAPPKGKEEPRKGYEYPVHQMLLKIRRPGQTGKKAFAYANVVKATYAGFKSDLIDAYKKLAISDAKSKGETKLAEKIGADTFNGGIRFAFGHALYVFDMDDRKKGFQLLTLSHAQFKSLEDSKLKLWKKKLSKNPKFPCPIASINSAYPVEIEKKDGAKTEYVIAIDNESDFDVLTSEELTALLAAPRIPEVIYRYTRYHFEATMAFLKQCDEDYGLKVMESDEMKEAIKSFEAEIPKDDTSSFSLDKEEKEGEAGAVELTFDSLSAKYDELVNAGIGDKTEGGQEFRVMLNEFIVQEKLDVKPTRKNTNAEILDMIEEALGEAGDSKEDENSDDENSQPAETEAPARRERRVR